MKIIDAHCDALSKLWKQSTEEISFRDSTELQTNLERLQEGQVAVQCFAIFIGQEIRGDQKFQVALEQINLFHSEVLGKNPMVKHMTSWDQLSQLEPNQIGAILTMEGVDAIGNDIEKLKILYHLGVKSVGLTWNFANLCADGALEERGAGLSSFGKEVVQLNNQHLVWTDVSHLNEKSFWDVLDIAEFPIASHSNSKTISDHPRNLSDRQAERLFQSNGFIGMACYPRFLRKHDNDKATIADMIKHIDHFCSLGGVKHITFGSDFDGITRFVQDLENTSKYQNLINELLKYYREEDVEGFAYQNFLNHRPETKQVVESVC